MGMDKTIEQSKCLFLASEKISSLDCEETSQPTSVGTWQSQAGIKQMRKWENENASLDEFMNSPSEESTKRSVYNENSKSIPASFEPEPVQFDNHSLTFDFEEFRESNNESALINGPKSYGNSSMSASESEGQTKSKENSDEISTLHAFTFTGIAANKRSMSANNVSLKHSRQRFNNERSIYHSGPRTKFKISSRRFGQPVNDAKSPDHVGLSVNNKSVFFYCGQSANGLRYPGGQFSKNVKLSDGSGQSNTNVKPNDRGGQSIKNVKLSDGVEQSSKNVKTSDVVEQSTQNVKLSDRVEQSTKKVKLSDGGEQSTQNVKLSDGFEQSTKNVKLSDGGEQSTKNVKLSDGVEQSTTNVKLTDGFEQSTKNVKLSDGVEQSAKNVKLSDSVEQSTKNVKLADGVEQSTKNVKTSDGVEQSTKKVKKSDGVEQSTKNVKTSDGGELSGSGGRSTKTENPFYSDKQSAFSKTPCKYNGQSENDNEKGYKYQNCEKNTECPTHVISYTKKKLDNEMVFANAWQLVSNAVECKIGRRFIHSENNSSRYEMTFAINCTPQVSTKKVLKRCKKSQHTGKLYLKRNISYIKKTSGENKNQSGLSGRPSEYWRESACNEREFESTCNRRCAFNENVNEKHQMHKENHCMKSPCDDMASRCFRQSYSQINNKLLVSAGRRPQSCRQISYDGMKYDRGKQSAYNERGHESHWQSAFDVGGSKRDNDRHPGYYTRDFENCQQSGSNVRECESTRQRDYCINGSDNHRQSARDVMGFGRNRWSDYGGKGYDNREHLACKKQRCESSRPSDIYLKECVNRRQPAYSRKGCERDRPSYFKGRKHEKWQRSSCNMKECKNCRPLTFCVRQSESGQQRDYVKGRENDRQSDYGLIKRGSLMKLHCGARGHKGSRYRQLDYGKKSEIDRKSDYSVRGSKSERQSDYSLRKTESGRQPDCNVRVSESYWQSDYDVRRCKCGRTPNNDVRRSDSGRQSDYGVRRSDSGRQSDYGVRGSESDRQSDYSVRRSESRQSDYGVRRSESRQSDYGVRRSESRQSDYGVRRSESRQSDYSVRRSESDGQSDYSVRRHKSHEHSNYPRRQSSGGVKGSRNGRLPFVRWSESCQSVGDKSPVCNERDYEFGWQCGEKWSGNDWQSYHNGRGYHRGRRNAIVPKGSEGTSRSVLIEKGQESSEDLIFSGRASEHSCQAGFNEKRYESIHHLIFNERESESGRHSVYNLGNRWYLSPKARLRHYDNNRQASHNEIKSDKCKDSTLNEMESENSKRSLCRKSLNAQCMEGCPKGKRTPPFRKSLSEGCKNCLNTEAERSPITTAQIHFDERKMAYERLGTHGGRHSGKRYSKERMTDPCCVSVTPPFSSLHPRTACVSRSLSCGHLSPAFKICCCCSRSVDRLSTACCRPLKQTQTCRSKCLQESCKNPTCAQNPCHKKHSDAKLTKTRGIAFPGCPWPFLNISKCFCTACITSSRGTLRASSCSSSTELGGRSSPCVLNWKLPCSRVASGVCRKKNDSCAEQGSLLKRDYDRETKKILNACNFRRKLLTEDKSEQCNLKDFFQDDDNYLLKNGINPNITCVSCVGSVGNSKGMENGTCFGCTYNPSVSPLASLASMVRKAFAPFGKGGVER